MVVPHPTNAVLVGRKPVMNYVLAIVRMMTQEGMNEVVVKARGSNINKAVDTVETVRHLFMKDIVLKNISISSEEVSDEEGRTRRISSIEITLVRGEG